MRLNNVLQFGMHDLLTLIGISINELISYDCYKNEFAKELYFEVHQSNSCTGLGIIVQGAFKYSYQNGKI